MAFAHQVGGHAATILASPLSSSTLIKPSSPRELEFYQSIAPTLNHGNFLSDWTPAFYGTLKLEGRVTEQGGAVQKLDPASEGHVEPEMLVLENLTHRFLHPNVLDIKLGTQLFDEDATEEKKARMTNAAAASTSGEKGVRLTGFQVWNAITSSYVQTPKPYGRALLASELPSGIARFFYPPLSSPSSAESSGAVPPTSTTPAALPADLLLPVLRTLARRLEALEVVLSKMEIRMRGGSLLIIVEGDAAALEAALLRAQAAQTKQSASAARGGSEASEEAAEEEDDDAASTSTTDSEGTAASHTLLPYELRLIDFAHTRAAPGEGPDEGVLLGVRTTKELIQGLVKKLEEQDKP
ncbi:hypothetical protein JCM11641_004116 [Rhodosporidiobolus odoratus]